MGSRDMEFSNLIFSNKYLLIIFWENFKGGMNDKTQWEYVEKCFQSENFDTKIKMNILRSLGLNGERKEVPAKKGSRRMYFVAS